MPLPIIIKEYFTPIWLGLKSHFSYTYIFSTNIKKIMLNNQARKWDFFQRVGFGVWFLCNVCSSAIVYILSLSNAQLTPWNIGVNLILLSAPPYCGEHSVVGQGWNYPRGGEADNSVDLGAHPPYHQPPQGFKVSFVVPTLYGNTIYSLFLKLRRLQHILHKLKWIRFTWILIGRILLFYLFNVLNYRNSCADGNQLV